MITNGEHHTPYIQTVLGQIPAASLGFCQCHEHLFIEKGASYQVNRDLYMANAEKSLREVIDYQQAGGEALVDAQPPGCGRMAAQLQQTSEKSGVSIIASTGFHKLIFYQGSHWIFDKDEEALFSLFYSELTEGMYVDADEREPRVRINAKAGIIKTALDSGGLTPVYCRLFRAAAKAQRQTGRALMVHVERSADPVVLLTFLQQEGVAADRIIFCHMDRACEDLSVHKALCLAGCYMEYDTIGRFRYHSDEREADLIREMIAGGYEERLLFSLDTTRARLRAYTKDGVGLTYILRVFVKIMREAGISDSQIRKIAYDNPARVLAASDHNKQEEAYI